MTIATKVWVGAAAGTFTLLVLAAPSMMEPAEASLGARTIARATPAELEMIRSGPITVAQYNTVTEGQADCLRKAGAIPNRTTHADGRVGYGATVSGEHMPQGVDRCSEIGEAVRATYIYDHVGFFSWTSAYPGLGAAVRQLRTP